MSLGWLDVEQMSLEDVFEAHMALDVRDALEQRARDMAEKK